MMSMTNGSPNFFAGDFRNAYLQPCSDNTFCCNELSDNSTSGRLNDTRCCSSSFSLGKQQIGIVVHQFEPDDSTSPTSSPTGTTTSGTVSSTPTDTGAGSAAASNLCDEQGRGPSGAVIAGLAVEGGLLLLSLAFLFAMLARYRKLKRQHGTEKAGAYHPGHQHPMQSGAYYGGAQVNGVSTPHSQQYYAPQHTGTTVPYEHVGVHNEYQNKIAEIDTAVPAHELAETS
jgi:hypothetical protein